MKTRLAWLDYLRGFCALGIMCFHYFCWGTSSSMPAESFLGKIGIYGVSIFYILSGLTLYQVYYHKMEPTIVSVQNFFIKRFFRIFPLLWLVTILTILSKQDMPDFLTAFLNFTGLFGFFKWDAYIAVGAWSIGNELVFYILFPFLVFSAKKNKAMFFIITLLFLLTYVYFAFYVLDPSVKVLSQWRNYVNPFNQGFLFIAGFMIGLFFEQKKIKNLHLVILLVIVSLTFIFYPVYGTQTQLVVMWNRLGLTVICSCLCLCFYKISIVLPQIIHYPLSKLGEATYSIYLLHPIVWTCTSYIFSQCPWMPFPVKAIVTFFTPIAISICIYYFFEKKFMAKGNEIINRRKVAKIQVSRIPDIVKK